MSSDHPLFAKALTFVDSGDVARLTTLLAEHRDLVHARSTSVEAPERDAAVQAFWEAGISE